MMAEDLTLPVATAAANPASHPNIVSATPSKTAAEKAADKTKSAEAKLLAETLKTVFLTPFSRMMRFLYMGLMPRSDVFILGTDKESKFRYGNPDQGLALIHLKTGERKDRIINFFAALGIDNTHYELVNLVEITTFLNKCKWDMSRVSTSRDGFDRLVIALDSGETEIVSEPIQIYFTFRKIEFLARSYTEALVDKILPVFSFSYRGDDTLRLSKIMIDVQHLHVAGFSDLPSVGHLRVLLTRGLDWLHVKELTPCTEDEFLGLRLWCPSGSSLFYMHVYDTAELTLASTRCNFFLIPHPRPMPLLKVPLEPIHVDP